MQAAFRSIAFTHLAHASQKMYTQMLDKFKPCMVANCILCALQHKHSKKYIVYRNPIVKYCTQLWSSPSDEREKTVVNTQGYYTSVALPEMFVGSYTPDYDGLWFWTPGVSLTEVPSIPCSKIVKNSPDVPWEDMLMLPDHRRCEV